MVQPPRVVADRYRLVQQLGQGGMGRVWLAHDDLLHRDVAIKEIVPPAGLTPTERQEMRERTLREARAIARLSHPNVVRIFDVLSSDGDPWIVMEYVRGRSLQDILATDGPLPVPRAVDLGLGVLAALRAAHRSGVLHRDVKPGNVLLGDDGRIVLTDFGLATVPGDPVVTRTGLVLGSPAYLAPERAKDGTAGPEADLWSLGATLYAAVEGQSPYSRPSAIATLAALATEPPAPAKQAGPLRPALNGLLRKKPSERISPEETERLLLRAAGPRWRQEAGRVPSPGVRLRRPPGPDTFAAAAGAAGAAGARRAAGLRRPTAGRSRPDPAPQTPAANLEAAETPAASLKAAEAPATLPDQRAPDAEPASAAAAAGVEAPAGTETPARDAPDVRATSVTAAATKTATETPGAREADVTTPDLAAADDSTKVEPGHPADPSSIDGEADSAVPIVPGPRVPVDRAWAVAAVPVPLREPPTGATTWQRRWWWIAAAIGVVLALVVVAVAMLSNDGDPEGAGGNPGGTASVGAGGAGAAAPSSDAATPSATSGASSPPPASAGGTGALPAGWRFYQDRTGFRVAAPEGWTVSRRGTMVYFREPGGGRVLGIDQTDRPKSDPVADWRQQEARRVAAGDWADYNRVKIAPVQYFEKAADWEFTYRGTSGRTHVINRGFVTSPRQAYAIYWSTPESEWSANLDNFRLIADTFKPRG